MNHINNSTARALVGIADARSDASGPHDAQLPESAFSFLHTVLAEVSQRLQRSPRE